MTGSVANTVWARSFVDELARSGLRDVIIAPGSRSTPLVMAFAADDRIRARVHLDERSAGFFALGVGKAVGRPAAVVTTSGTAVANLLPAVVEACQAGVPLLILTADRPHRLRGADANQAIDQAGIFGGFTRGFHEMAPPTLDEAALRHLRAVACRAFGATLAPEAGPVHVNFPFDKPLEPEEPGDDAGGAVGESVGGAVGEAIRGREDGSPFTRVRRGAARLAEGELDQLLEGVDPARGVIVAGPTEQGATTGPAVVAFASATGFPLLADPLSGARYGSPGAAHVVAGYDLFLREEAVMRRLAPSLVVRVGAAPTSAALQRWLARHSGVEQIVIDAGGRWKDHGATASRYALADPVDTLRRAGARWSETGDHDAGLPRADLGWADSWLRCDDATRRALDADAARSGEASREGGAVAAHEGEIVAAALTAMPSGANLVVSSSMPIRDLDAFGHPRPEPLSVYANRGASGIDGVVSTAFGIASQSDAPTVCVIGDVAFFHDQNGLLWSREEDAPVVFLLVDNDGGGIFHMLPIADHDPDFTRFFATPHGLDPRHAADAHGLAFREVEAEEVGVGVAETAASGETSVIRVRTDRRENRRRHREIEEAVGRSVREALG